jgi:hypothetical protein
MRKLSPMLFVAACFIFASCEELKELLRFEIKHSQTFTLPAQFVLPGANLAGSPLAVTSNSEESFKNNNTRADLVKDVTLHKLVLTIQDPANEDFGFLKDVEIFIDADGADEVRLAYLNDIPANAGNSIELTSTNAKLDKYIKATTFSIRTRATVDEAITRDVTIKTDMTFQVTADPL